MWVPVLALPVTQGAMLAKSVKLSVPVSPL